MTTCTRFSAHAGWSYLFHAVSDTNDRSPTVPSLCQQTLAISASIQPTFAAVVGRQFLRPFETGIDFNPYSDLYLVWKGILCLADNSSNPDLLPGTLCMMILRTLNQ